MPKLICIGNAVLDIFSKTPTGFLESLNITKGSMTLVDDLEKFKTLENDGLDHQISSGGSAINTAAAFAILSKSTKVFVKLGKDANGIKYKQDLENLGITVISSICPDKPNAKSRVYISEDGERTMLTYLGATSTIYPNDFDLSELDNDAMIFCEGYMFDSAPELMKNLAVIIKDKGLRSSLTLSDSECVKRNYQKIADFVKQTNPIVFANSKELAEFKENAYQFIVHTKSEDGSEVIENGKIVAHAPAIKVNKVIDATGAGDVFAGTFLYYYLSSSDLNKSLAQANLAASKVIQKIGARL